MSLINDALKRAAEAQKQGPPDSPPTVPLLPVDYAPRPNPFFGLLAVLALLALVGVAVWAFSRWWHTSRQAQQPGGATNVVVAQSAPALQSAVDAVAPGQHPTTGPMVKVSTSVVVRSRSSAPPVAAATPPTETMADETRSAGTNTVGVSTNGLPAFPGLKLQSIIYRLNKPAVVIDGEMLHVGDVIREARVVKIERYTVTVEWKGETRELSLPRL